MIGGMIWPPVELERVFWDNAVELFGVEPPSG
jgi:hypothetical protein